MTEVIDREGIAAAQPETATAAARRVYVQGSRDDLRVPFREIAQAPTGGASGYTPNPPLRLYDTSGPHGDPEVTVDPERGLPRIADTVDPRARRRRGRLGSARDHPARAQRCGGDPAGLRAPGNDHPRDGVHRHPRGRRARAGPRRGRARPRDHPRQHQPPRGGADDHRHEVPRQGEREHRQLRGALEHRRRGREDALGDALGIGHHHGSVHRQGHPRDPRVDHAQLASSCRNCPDLPGAREGRRQCGSALVGDLPRHDHRAGRAGCRLLHDPRRRAPALRPAHREARHRDRLPRRLDHGGVVPRAPPGELPVHAFRGSLRDPARVRRVLLTRRRTAPGFALPTPTTRHSSASCARSAS